jgi:hypothetical protein
MLCKRCFLFISEAYSRVDVSSTCRSGRPRIEDRRTRGQLQLALVRLHIEAWEVYLPLAELK